jgi:hypothetical protein
MSPKVTFVPLVTGRAMDIANRLPSKFDPSPMHCYMKELQIDAKEETNK